MSLRLDCPGSDLFDVVVVVVVWCVCGFVDRGGGAVVAEMSFKTS